MESWGIELVVLAAAAVGPAALAAAVRGFREDREVGAPARGAAQVAFAAAPGESPGEADVAEGRRA